MNISRRGLLMAFLTVPVTSNAVAAPRGFHIDGKLTAQDGERLEGYFNVGREYLIATKPTSAIYPLLVEMIDHDVHVYVTPA